MIRLRLIIGSSRDESPFPWATFSLLTLLGGVYVLTWATGLSFATVVEYSVVPRRPSLVGLLAALFLHAGGFHLLYNAAPLWFVGREVERRLGPVRLIALFLLGGVGANLVQLAVIRLLLPPDQDLPIIGASGAVAVLIGAFAGFHPFAHVRVLAEPRPSPETGLRIPLAWVWGGWLASQLIGALSMFFHSAATVGYWGHAAGFVIGAGVALTTGYLHSGSLLPALESAWDAEDRPPPDLSAETAEELRDALRAEAAGKPLVAERHAVRLVRQAVHRREAPRALRAYQWLAMRRSLHALDPSLRFELALLLENEGAYTGAGEVLSRLADDTRGATAAEALLALARLCGGPLHDPARADELLSAIQAKYGDTPAALLASVEWGRTHPSR